MEGVLKEKYDDLTYRVKTNEADCNNLGLLWIREKVLALSSELSIGKAWSNNNGAEHDTPPLSRYSRRVGL